MSRHVDADPTTNRVVLICSIVRIRKSVQGSSRANPKCCLVKYTHVTAFLREAGVTSAEREISACNFRLVGVVSVSDDVPAPAREFKSLFVVWMMVVKRAVSMAIWEEGARFTVFV